MRSNRAPTLLAALLLAAVAGRAADVPIDVILDTDRVFTRGTQAYAAAGGRLAGAERTAD